MNSRRAVTKLVANPVGAFSRLWKKLVVYPLRYGKSEGAYNARLYWDDRLVRYGDSLQGPGDEGLSEIENIEEYASAAAQFQRACRELEIELADAQVLEIGPGTGFYTRQLADLGVCQYVGVDIAGAQLPRLALRFPNYHFLQADVTQWTANDKFDLIVIVDVIEHIVRHEDLCRALRNLHNCLRPGGKILIAPISEISVRHLFYVHYWSRHALETCLPGYSWQTALTFRSGLLVVLQRPAV